MADIGRWGVIDPLSEAMMPASVYSYAHNNPVGFIDLFGMAPYDPNNNRMEPRDLDLEDPFSRRMNAKSRYKDPDNFYIKRGEAANSEGPDNDYTINDDGTIVLKELTDDHFHRFYNQDGKLIYQTNWTKNDVGNHIGTLGGETPARDFINELYTLILKMRDPINERIVAHMWNDAGEKGWTRDEMFGIGISDYKEQARNWFLSGALNPLVAPQSANGPGWLGAGEGALKAATGSSNWKEVLLRKLESWMQGDKKSGYYVPNAYGPVLKSK